jgi:hypothetical protein
LKNEATIYKVANEVEELKAKYEIEKSNGNDSKYLIYTSTPKNNLKFVREYCETNGCVEIKYLDHYIKKKVSQHLNLNINLPKEELISAAKVSVGKDQTYWMDLSHKGASEIFDLEKVKEEKENSKTLEEFTSSLKEVRLQGFKFIDKLNLYCEENAIDKKIKSIIIDNIVETQD